MKRLFCLILCLILTLSLAACGPAPSGPTGTVANPFTQGTTAATDSPSLVTPSDPTETVANPFTQGTTAAATDPPSFSFGKRPNRPAEYNCMLTLHASDDNQGLIYSGGETTCVLRVKSDGLSETGIGMFLFVDGVPQPYRTDAQPDSAYLHSFYPEVDVEENFTIYFTPVTGKEGDQLEVWSCYIQYPDYAPTQVFPFFGAFPITFTADPPAQELPACENYLVDQTVSFEDLTLGEASRWSGPDILINNAHSFKVLEAESNSSFVGGLTSKDQLHVRYEVYGSTLFRYRVVFFLDAKPIAVAPEDLALIEVRQGEKTVVEATISLEGLMDYQELYAALIPLNYIYDENHERQPYNYCEATLSGPYTISSAATYEDLVKADS